MRQAISSFSMTKEEVVFWRRAGPSLIQLEVFVKDLEAIRKEFGFDKVTILGHS